VATAFLCTLAIPALRAADSKPVFLYSRYFNAPGEARYLADGNYREVLQRLAKDFRVQTHDQPLDAATLAGVNLLLIANPGDIAVSNQPAPHHVQSRDTQALTQFVKGGGALIVMGNQENHNLETKDLNKLLLQFGLQFTNLYTDAKLLPISGTTPIIGGLRWGYYTGNLLLIDAGHPARPRGLIMNELAIKPAKGERDQAGPLLAIAEPGQGRVVVVTDAGWICDWAFEEKGVGGVALKGQDNWEIFRRLCLWAAHR